MSSTTMRTKSQRVSARRRSRSRARRCSNGGVASSKVSDKLEALKSLIPASDGGGEIVKADQLFEQTADYIVRLRTQVAVLQTLIDFYGSSDAETLVS